MDIEPRALGIFDEQRAGMTSGIARASVLCSVCWIQFLEMFSVSANQTRIASLPKMLLDTWFETVYSKLFGCRVDGWAAASAAGQPAA